MSEFKKLLGKVFDKSLLKFLVVGVLNTLVGMGIMLLLSYLFNKYQPVFAQKLIFRLGAVDYTASYIISSVVNYVLGGILSYFLNKYWSFKYTEKSYATVFKFILTVVLCYAVSYLGAKPLVEILLKNSSISNKWKEFIALIVGAGLYTVLNYFGQKFFAFVSSNKKAVEAAPTVDNTQDEINNEDNT